MPDTFNIIAVSSAGAAPQAGSALYLDDMQIEATGAGVHGIIAVDELVRLSPNPTPGILQVELLPNETNQIAVFDYSGKQVLTSGSNENHAVLDMSSFSNGVYFIEISNSKGRHTNKFVLAK